MVENEGETKQWPHAVAVSMWFLFNSSDEMVDQKMFFLKLESVDVCEIFVLYDVSSQ